MLFRSKKYETEKEKFQSPVLDALEKEPSIMNTLKRQRAVDRLNMLFYGLENYTMRLSTKIKNYILPLLPDYLGKDLDNISKFGDFLNFILKYRKTLESLDWSKLFLRISPIPAIEAYLIEPPIINLIPIDYEWRYTKLIANYYYLLTQDLQDVTNPVTSRIIILAESMVLSNLTTVVIGFIMDSNDIHTKDLSEKFDKHYEISELKERDFQTPMMADLLRDKIYINKEND